MPLVLLSILHTQCSSVQFSRSVVSDSLQPHESQHARPPCPSPTPGVYSNSCPSNWWCHPAISSSVVPFSSCPQPLPASSGSEKCRILSLLQVGAGYLLSVYHYQAAINTHNASPTMTIFLGKNKLENVSIHCDDMRENVYLLRVCNLELWTEFLSGNHIHCLFEEINPHALKLFFTENMDFYGI